MYAATSAESARIDWADMKKVGQRNASYFLGPKAANAEIVTKFFEDIIMPAICQARINFHPSDQYFITAETKKSEEYLNAKAKLRIILENVSTYMAEHAIPFHFPRYMAHMVMEPSLPATLGYIIGIFYNTNNSTPEASPFTTIIESFLGQDLCEMLGFRRRPKDMDMDTSPKALEEAPIGWGHITAGGSIANLESMWAARNLKYYPLSLKNAMTQGPDPPLAFVYDTFKIKLCTGEVKLFKDCTTWELLNLKSHVILGIPDTLAIEYGISTEFVQSAMTKYIIQTVGKDALEKQYCVKPPQILISHTNHFSWPKAAAILGIGSANMVEVPVDIYARVDIDELERYLAKALAEQRALYATVAIFGTTELGAVDPVSKILELRKKYESMGLSFLVNVDAAWGGYFTSIIRPDPENPGVINVPAMMLSEHTRTEMEHLQYVDAITLDPHKSGYCPYPGGGLCYRDERMRFLVTWGAPYVVQGGRGVETMGAYGVEGSKPGASPLGAWIASFVIGLHSRGYGALLAQSIYTSARMWCHWAANMETSDFYSTTISLFPSERGPKSILESDHLSAIQQDKDFIRSHILFKDNEGIFKDQQALNFLMQTGSDLMINAWALNFKVGGVANTNPAEANHFNQRIHAELTMTSPVDDLNNFPLIVMGSTLSNERYGKCLRVFKKRIGLDVLQDDDLFCLINVSMSPFPTTEGSKNEGTFVAVMADAFRDKAGEIVRELLWRNTPGSDRHSFIVQGKNSLYFTHIPNFHSIRSRKQFIFSGDVPKDVLDKLHLLQEHSPGAVFTLHTEYEEDLDGLANKGKFSGMIDEGVPRYLGMYLKDGKKHTIPAFEVTNVKVIKSRILQSPYLDFEYPERMPFYMYGTLNQEEPEKSEVQLDHIIRMAPNVSLSSSNIKLDVNSDYGNSQLADELKKGVIVVFDKVFERALLPYSRTHRPAWFVPEKMFEVTIYMDRMLEPASGRNLPFPENYGFLLANGRITLGRSVFADFENINKDPTPAFINLEKWGKGVRTFGYFLGEPSDKPHDSFHQELGRLQHWEEDVKKKLLFDQW